MRYSIILAAATLSVANPIPKVFIRGRNIQPDLISPRGGADIDLAGVMVKRTGDDGDIDGALNAPILPRGGIDIDLAGVMVKRTGDDGDIDGALNAPILPRGGIDIDLAGVMVKRTGNDGGIDVTQTLGPAGDLVDGITNALPVDVALNAPVVPNLRPRAKIIVEPVIQYN
jgi:hypothetical protein